MSSGSLAMLLPQERRLSLSGLDSFFLIYRFFFVLLSFTFAHSGGRKWHIVTLIHTFPILLERREWAGYDGFGQCCHGRRTGSREEDDGDGPSRLSPPAAAAAAPCPSVRAAPVVGRINQAGLG